MSWLEAILSLLVIVDPIGNIPTFLGVTAGIAEEKRQRAFTVSVMVAAGILLVFSFTGDLILRFVFQIEIADLQIAGGILLLVMAVDDLVFGSRRHPGSGEETLSAEEIGCVPLGCPLLAGPGAIATTLTIWKSQNAGPWVALLAIIVVLVLFRAIMYHVEQINRLFGRLIITAISKVMLVFLAAIGVRMLLAGLSTYWPIIR